METGTQATLGDADLLVASSAHALLAGETFTTECSPAAIGIGRRNGQGRAAYGPSGRSVSTNPGGVWALGGPSRRDSRSGAGAGGALFTRRL
jgi:hypothetical protein